MYSLLAIVLKAILLKVILLIIPLGPLNLWVSLWDLWLFRVPLWGLLLLTRSIQFAKGVEINSLLIIPYQIARCLLMDVLWCFKQHSQKSYISGYKNYIRCPAECNLNLRLCNYFFPEIMQLFLFWELRNDTVETINLETN